MVYIGIRNILCYHIKLDKYMKINGGNQGWIDWNQTTLMGLLSLKMSRNQVI